MALLRRTVVLTLVVLASRVAFPQEKILDFPVNWDKRGPYGRFLPKNENGKRGAWSCGQVAHAMIIRYLAMHHDLQIQGSHFYYLEGTGERVSADFDEPFRWDRMLPSLEGIPVDDPRVDPVADFVYRFCVAMRTDWWNPARNPWVSDYHVKETMARYYGIDVSEYRRGPLAKWAEEHSWDALHERINQDIDAGYPCELVVTGFGKVCHEVILTGYRRVDGHYEYTIHFGGPRYDPSKSFRLDRPILGWDDPAHFLISWGIKPYAKGERAPLYNTILQESGALDPNSRTDVVWNGSEYALVMPSGRNGDRSVVFQRISASGRACGNRVVLASGTPNLPKPAIEWGNGRYAAAWLGTGDTGQGVYLNLLTETGERVLPADVFMGNQTLWPGIARSGTRFGLCFLNDTSAKFALIADDGAILKTTTVADDMASPNVVWTGRHFALSCLDNRSKEVCLRLLDEDAEPLGDLSRMKVDGAERLSECRLGFTGEGYGLAFIKHRGGEPPVVAFCLADKQGRFLPGSLTTLSDPKQSARTVDVSFKEGVFYVTYRYSNGSYSLYLVRVSQDGSVMDTRWLVYRPDSVCHTQGPDGLTVVSLRNIPPGKGIEVVSCIVPRKEAERTSAWQGSVVGAVAAGLIACAGVIGVLYRQRLVGIVWPST